MTEEVKKPNFDFQIAGNTSDDRLLVLVDDHLFGKCAYIIKDVDESNKLDYELVKTFQENIPEERQQRILTAILEQIVTESRDL